MSDADALRRFRSGLAPDFDYAKFRALEIEHEGKRNNLYRDIKGKLSIGIGRNLSDVGVSDSEIFILFDNDVTTALRALFKNYPRFATLNAARQAVLLDMCFNAGWRGLSEYHRMFAAIEAGDFARAGVELLDSDAAREAPRRARTLYRMMTSGTW
jgi:lysozyme